MDKVTASARLNFYGYSYVFFLTSREMAAEQFPD